MADGYWNGQPAEIRAVRIIIGDDGRHTAPWYGDLVGQERRAVAVHQNGRTFYLDDADGSGWHKVTEGRGAPCWSHGELVAARELATPRVAGGVVDLRVEPGAAA